MSQSTLSTIPESDTDSNMGENPNLDQNNIVTEDANTNPEDPILVNNSDVSIDTNSNKEDPILAKETRQKNPDSLKDKSTTNKPIMKNPVPSSSQGGAEQVQIKKPLEKCTICGIDHLNFVCNLIRFPELGLPRLPKSIRANRKARGLCVHCGQTDNHLGNLCPVLNTARANLDDFIRKHGLPQPVPIAPSKNKFKWYKPLGTNATSTSTGENQIKRKRELDHNSPTVQPPVKKGTSSSTSVQSQVKTLAQKSEKALARTQFNHANSLKFDPVKETVYKIGICHNNSLYTNLEKSERKSFLNEYNEAWSELVWNGKCNLKLISYNRTEELAILVAADKATADWIKEWVSNLKPLVDKNDLIALDLDELLKKKAPLAKYTGYMRREHAELKDGVIEFYLGHVLKKELNLTKDHTLKVSEISTTPEGKIIKISIDQEVEKALSNLPAPFSVSVGLARVVFIKAGPSPSLNYADAAKQKTNNPPQTNEPSRSEDNQPAQSQSDGKSLIRAANEQLANAVTDTMDQSETNDNQSAPNKSPVLPNLEEKEDINVEIDKLLKE